ADATVCVFVQADGGVRDGHVTGVQTCALPIWSSPATAGSTSWAAAAAPPRSGSTPSPAPSRASPRAASPTCPTGRPTPAARPWKSEERRVGKECRREGAPDEGKKEE